MLLLSILLSLLLTFSTPSSPKAPACQCARAELVESGPVVIGFESDAGRLFVIQQVEDGEKPTAPNNAAVLLQIHPLVLKSIWLTAHDDKGGVVILQLKKGEMFTLFLSDGSAVKYQVVGFETVRSGATAAEGSMFNRDGVVLLQTCIQAPGKAILVVAEKVE